MLLLFSLGARYPGVALLVCVGRGALLLCCVAFRLLPWHSVMETTMVEPVRRGAFTPWHQTWRRAHPGFSAAPAGLSNKPALPSPSIHSLAVCVSPRSGFTFCLRFSRFSPLSVAPAFLQPCLLFISPPVSPLNFILSFATTKTAIQPWHLGANKTSSENAKPAQKCHRSRDFCLKNRSRSPRQSYFVFLAH